MYRQKTGWLACGMLLAMVWAAGALGAGSSPQGGTVGGKIGPDALWQPGMHFLQQVHRACDGAGVKFGDCFTAEMARSGAPAAAVAFTRQTGNQGILRDFRAAGPVGIAYAVYLYRANENQVWLLVNGEPPMIDVDDYALFPRKELEKNAAYQIIRRQYPQAEVYPGDRAGTKGPGVRKLKKGGVRIVVHYRLKNLCHACEQIGSVEAGFDFDGRGKLNSVRLLEVSPATPRSAAAEGKR